MKIFIRSTACISPQKTFGKVSFLNDVLEYHGNRLKIIDPDYSASIEPKLLRRMSHIIKMGVSAALECLTDSGIETPGAIITGTAYGCIEDTVSFLSRIIELKEELLPPTAFIQSTHNTVAAQIALILKCHSYNNTFVHKGISFESALLDAIMLLNEKEADNILVGGTDEMTETSYNILTRLGLFKRRPVSNLSILSSHSKGTIGGEGAAFFLVTGKGSIGNVAAINDLHTFYKPSNQEEIEKNINAFLAKNSIPLNEIDLVLMGKNGDTKNDTIYNQLSLTLFKKTNLANYKHLCGEYPTSSAFALWLAANCIKNNSIPKSIVETKNTNENKIKKILIYNHYQFNYHSLMLVSSC